MQFKADFWVSNRGIELDIFFSILKANSVVICIIQNSSAQLYACKTRKAHLQVSVVCPVLKKVTFHAFPVFGLLPVYAPAHQVFCWGHVWVPKQKHGPALPS